MYKKSLYLGAAALALLMVLALAGCSNPASDDGGAAPQAGGSAVIPDGAVYTADFFELQGLLNDYSADTNQVSHIVYTEDVAIADFPSPLTIPAGKTVYLNNASNNGVAFSAVEVNIIVEEGARLVLLADFTTDGADKRLLVKGLADIYAGLTVDNALDVADYFIDANGTVTARGTVIGTGRVVIHSGGTLNLVADDIAPQPSTDRFTPAQAWAAAGQGSLAITGPLPANYSVVDVLAGVSPGGGRTYTVVTNGGGVLPQVIPAGAFITANGVITDAEGHTLRVHGSLTATHAASTFADVVTLTVNGELIANAATFENVETLTVSSLDTDNLTSRASTGSAAVWNRSYLGADKATLKKAKSVIIGDRGEFASESTAIDLPAGARISLGRSASFTASGTTNNSFDKLESLFVGPASSVAIASTAVTLKSLKTLTLQDSASFAVNTAGNSVTYLVEDTPPTPPNKTQINLGLNTLYLVGTAPSAKVAVTIASDSSLRATSVLAIYAGSTFTVDAGKTLTVPTGAVVDFSAVTTGATAVPTAPDLAPIQINGTIETTGTGSIVGPATVAGLPAGADLNKFIAFGAGGKVLLNWGTSFLYGTAAFVGTASSPFQWKTTPTDGAQIELNAAGLTIRDTDGGGAAVTVGAPATVLKDQTLTLDTGAQLLVTVA
ncbi:MAG: hypothetical protein LBC60_06175, partial [Spirochaetaceae bacterium]|nr:hypothetical protein [Spirochaetaceae bacterium]